MDYRGLDFGSGLAHYSDLMAKGYKDQIALQQEMDRADREAQTQQLNNEMNVQNANKTSGYLDNNPELFQALGGSLVRPFDPNNLQGVAPPQGRIPQAMPAPSVSPPGTVGAPTDPSQIPSSGVSPSVDQNVQFQNAHRQAITQLAQQNNGMVTPFVYEAAKQMAMKKMENDALMARYKMIDQGKTARAETTTDAKIDKKPTVEQAAIENHIKMLNEEELKYKTDFRASLVPGAAERMQQIPIERAALMAQLTGKAPSQQAAPAGPSDEQIFQAYRAQHPSVKDTPSNREKILKATKGK